MRFMLFDEQLPPIRGHPIRRQGRKKGRLMDEETGVGGTVILIRYS